jgi:predicted  nucleic acid-binding Zn-ribbon protein
MARPIEHFENIESPEERADQLHHEIERLKKVQTHLRQGLDQLDDVRNPGSLGGALEDDLEQIRKNVSQSWVTADNALHDLQQRLDELKRMRDEALDEHHEVE